MNRGSGNAKIAGICKLCNCLLTGGAYGPGFRIIFDQHDCKGQTMHPFHQSMVTELGELNQRLDTISEFVDGEKFPTLSELGQDLIRQQLVAMETYADILSQRVALL